jgi:hypothetical protein
MSPRRCGIAVALLTVALPASWSAAEPGSHGTTPTVDCATRSQTIGRVPDAGPGDAVAGPLILRGAGAWAHASHDYLEPRRPGQSRQAKMPFIVAAGHPVTLSLTGRSVSHASVIVGLDQRPYGLRAAAIRFDPCPPDATVGDRRVGPRTVFVGGFRVDGPQCLHISVLPDGTADPINRRLALGRGTCRPQPG